MLSLKCVQCHKLGLYYFCEDDLVAQLWFVGREMRTQFTPLYIKSATDQQYLTPEKLAKLSTLAHLFVKLTSQVQTDAELFSYSPRYQWKLEQLQAMKKLFQQLTLLLPNVLWDLILGYHEPIPRYLFPIQEQISEDILTKHLGPHWKDLYDYISKTYSVLSFGDLGAPLLGKRLEDLPRTYYIEVSDYDGNNSLPHVIDWHMGFDENELTIQRTVLYCGECLLTHPILRQSPIGVVSASPLLWEPQPPSLWPQFSDQNLFHYDDWARWEPLLHSYLRTPLKISDLNNSESSFD